MLALEMKKLRNCQRNMVSKSYAKLDTHCTTLKSKLFFTDIFILLNAVNMRTPRTYCTIICSSYVLCMLFVLKNFNLLDNCICFALWQSHQNQPRENAIDFSRTGGSAEENRTTTKSC